MELLKNPSKRFALLMWLIAIHSFCVGLALIFSSPAVFQFLGFEPYAEKFFPVQGGTFHIIMSIGYGLAAYDWKRFSGLVIFSIICKSTAFVFLVVYFIFVSQIYMVLHSAIGDGIMAVLMIYFYRKADFTE